jgi:hypothetical protein
MSLETFDFSVKMEDFLPIKSFLSTVASQNTSNLKLIGFKFAKSNQELYDILTLNNVTQTKAQANNSAVCTICNKSIVRKSIIQHVAKHILAGQTLASGHVCGYCGSSSTGCTITLNKGTGKNLNPESSCPNFFKFNYKAAEKSTNTSPCTNRPILCQLFSICKKHVWTYNLSLHYKEYHPNETMDDETKKLMPTQVEISAILKLVVV